MARSSRSACRSTRELTQDSPHPEDRAPLASFIAGILSFDQHEQPCNGLNPVHPPSKTLRQFVCLWLACFGGLAAWEGIVREHTNLAATLAVLALTVGLVGIIWPQTMRPIYVAWMVLAFPIGWTISQMILG